MSRHRTSTLLAFIALAAAPVLAACGASAATGVPAGSGSPVKIQAGDDSCEVDRTDLDAGPTTFDVINTGSQVTEVYVYGGDGEEFTKVVSEVENIGPGTSRDMVVDLGGGTYEVACKPGQSGDGIRTAITVAGGASEDSAESDSGYDREIELTTDGSILFGLEGKATTGERIEFKLTNNADAPRTLELKDSSGAVVGEVADIEVGATGELVVELAQAGTWKVVVEAEGADDITADLTES